MGKAMRGGGGGAQGQVGGKYFLFCFANSFYNEEPPSSRLSDAFVFGAEFTALLNNLQSTGCALDEQFRC